MRSLLQWWDFLLVSYQLDPKTMDAAHANLCTGLSVSRVAVLFLASPSWPDVPLWPGAKGLRVKQKEMQKGEQSFTPYST